MKRVTQYTGLALLIMVLAAALRLPHLDIRPMHADESVQAIRFRDLWQRGHYVYDPHEYHGPTLSYATLPAAWLSDANNYAESNESMYRIVTALFGLAVVASYFLFSRLLGLVAVFSAALWAALSPAMVFYSRYYIHEMLFAFFTLVALAAAWHYVTSRKLGWLLLSGASIGLMQATKETAAIAYLAAAFACLMMWLAALLGRFDTKQRAARQVVVNSPSIEGVRRWPMKHLLAALAVALLIAILLLSSFFTNLRGPLDGVLTYLPWLSRAGGNSPHVYPWTFYLHRLIFWRIADGPVFSEGVIVALAVVGMIYGVVAKQTAENKDHLLLVRWFSWYGVAITTLYCLIPYKTPWCLIQFLIVLILLAGVGTAAILHAIRSVTWTSIVAVLLLLGAAQLGWQAYRASFILSADIVNPYVFAHTSRDLLGFAETMQGLGETSEPPWQVTVQVIWTDAYYWPLPWYLRRFENVAWWQHMPDQAMSPIVISAPPYGKTLHDEFGRDYIMVLYELRPQVFLQLWVEFTLWETYLRRIGRIE